MPYDTPVRHSHTRMLARIVLVAATAAVCGALVGARTGYAATTTLYVGGSGCSDSGSGTQSQPYCTVVQAAKVATAGQTVLVSAGSYSGQVTVANSGTATAPITFTSADDADVTITGGTYGFYASSKSYVTIEGFDVTGTTSYGMLLNNSNHITVADNTVTLAGQPVKGEIAFGIDLSGTSSSVITGNTTDHNSNSGIFLNTSSSSNLVSYNEASFNAEGYQRNANGIDVTGTNNTILGNVLHDNEDSGLQFYTGGNDNLATLNVSYNNGDHGIDDLNVTGGRIIGNTIYHNCTSGINVEGTSGNYIVENNIAVDNAVYPAYNGISCNRRAGNIGIWDSAPPTTTVDSNLVYLSKPGTMYVFGSSYSSLSAMQAATGQEVHGVQADPHFANAAAGNLQLTEGSAAIDAANSGVSGEQLTDILGAARVDDPNVPNKGIGPRAYDDMGAYEFTAFGAPQAPNAALAVTPSSGSAPLAVTADASASHDPQGQTLSYTFDFGDGTTVGPQATATANHTYTAAGTYTVKVTVTNTSNLTASATSTVTVNPAAQGPTAALTVTPTSGTAPLAVTADASASHDPQGQTLSYTFDFGDGTTVGPQAAATANHTYTAAGTYTVKVTVTNTSNLTVTATSTVTVSSAGTGNPAFVNQIATNYSTSAHTSGSITVWRTPGVVAGDMEIVTVQLTGAPTTGTFTGVDDRGNTLSVAEDISDASGDRFAVLYGIVHTALAVNDKINVTFPGTATTYRIIGDEISGATSVDKAVGAAGTAATFSSGATGTTSSAKEFVFGAVGVFNGTSPSWASGWTAETVYSNGANYAGRAYRITTSTGSFTATGTTTGAWLAVCVTFQ